MPLADHEVTLELDPNNGEAGECEDPRCNRKGHATFFCVDCASEYCAECWPLQGPHRKNKVGRDGLPHERTDAKIFRRFREVLQPPVDSMDKARIAHKEDSRSKWFGVTKDQHGRLKFDDYGRYSTFLSTLDPNAARVHRYPQLVSFVGVTNAGKSTIIKMLITKALSNMHMSDTSAWASPLVGTSVHDSIPTSGDVNLYADPRTSRSTLPILFADCEGFEGGERLPLGAMARWRIEKQSGHSTESVTGSAASYLIDWAKTDETRQREFAVMNLYPRILYTFSDVVVFVLRNPKTFQSSVLIKLLDWGVNSLEQSINQPALPHAIVVLNASDPGLDEREWNTSFATQNLLSTVKDAIDGPDAVPKLKKLAEHWRSLGKSIHTCEDLVLQYYSSFQVVRVPSSRYMLMDEQVSKLQTMIETSCSNSFQAKRRARMLTDADELNTYFQAAFRHFTTHLNVPFDFVDVSFRNNVIPSNFGGHILHLATRVMAFFEKGAARLAWFFHELATMLASCVMLDCVRFRKGRMLELFRNYQHSIDWVLTEFFELHWPCDFVDGVRRCSVVKARHIKGHQDLSGVIAHGDYQSKMTHKMAGSAFRQTLQTAISTIQRDFDYEADQTRNAKNVVDHEIALSLHVDYLRRFFAEIKVAHHLFSHSTCFVCLMHAPSHPLPCGHVICSACVKDFGKSRGRATMVVSECPLHDDSGPWTKWPNSIPIYFKPKGVGVRVLTLDSGGIRGIVQLEILREIEEALANQIPIACFLDLIVGSGTGAVIAAALGIQKRPLSPETIDMFIALCDLTYSPRLQIKTLMRLAQLMGGSGLYKTKPIRQALEVAFSEDGKIFGGVKANRTELRVGLLASTVVEKQGVLLANYSRSAPPQDEYKFERPHDPTLEMNLWESLAAATATPGFFKPYLNEQSHRTYIDVSATIPNPSAVAERERKLIWPDVEHLDPDMFLNLGAGQNRYRIINTLRNHQNRQATEPPKPKGLAQAGSIFKSSTKEDIIQAELAWLTFEEDLPPSLDGNGRHYLRFNPDLGEDPPAADDRGSLRALQQTVRNRLKLPHRQTALQHLAHRLFATSFYFDMQTKTVKADGSYICRGSILTRFEDGSEYIPMLGRFLQIKSSRSFEPYFLVHPIAGAAQAFKIPITKMMVDLMVRKSYFEIRDVEIDIQDESRATSITLFLNDREFLSPAGNPISGFPRWLLLDKSPRLVAGARLPGPAFVPIPDRSAGQTTAPSSGSDATPPNEKDLIPASNQESKAFASFEGLGIKPCDQPDPKSEILAQHATCDRNEPTRQRRDSNQFWPHVDNQHMVRTPENLTEEQPRRSVGDAIPPPQDLRNDSPTLPSKTFDVASSTVLSPTATSTKLEVHEPVLRPATSAESIFSDDPKPPSSCPV